MAGVERPLDLDAAAIIGIERVEGGGELQAKGRPLGVEETEHGGSAVEIAEPVPKSGAGDEAAPALTGEGSVDEACEIDRGQAEEDLLDEVVH